MAYSIEIESVNLTTDFMDDEETETVQVELQLLSTESDPKWRNVRGNISLETPMDHSANAVMLGKTLNECYRQVADNLGEWLMDAEDKYRPKWPAVPPNRRKPRPSKPEEQQ